MSKRDSGLGRLLLLAAVLGAQSCYPYTRVPPPAVWVVGELRYVDKDSRGGTLERPIRGVRVEIRKKASEVTIQEEARRTGMPTRTVRDSLETLLGEGTTDASGLFRARTTRVPPGTLIYGRFYAKTTLAEVFVDRPPASGGALDWGTAAVSFPNPSSGTQVSLPRRVVGPDLQPEGFSQHFNILNTIWWGHQFIQERRSDTDAIPLVYVEYPGATVVQAAGRYDDSQSPAVIELLGPDASGMVVVPTQYDFGFNDSAILHEYGHHWMNQIGKDESPGGPWDWYDATDPSLGWSEGCAEFFAYVSALTFPTEIDWEVPSRYGQTTTLPHPTSPVGTIWTLGALWSSTTDYWDRFDGRQERVASVQSGIGDYYPIADVIFHILDLDMEWNFPATLTGFHDAWEARGKVPLLSAGYDAWKLDRYLMRFLALTHPIPEYGPLEISNPEAVIEIPQYKWVQSGGGNWYQAGTRVGAEVLSSWNGVPSPWSGADSGFYPRHDPQVRLYFGNDLSLSNPLNQSLFFSPTLARNAQEPFRVVNGATVEVFKLSFYTDLRGTGLFPTGFLPVGNYRLLLTVDVDPSDPREFTPPLWGGLVPESDETNNMILYEIRIVPGPPDHP